MEAQKAWFAAGLAKAQAKYSAPEPRMRTCPSTVLPAAAWERSQLALTACLAGVAAEDSAGERVLTMPSPQTADILKSSYPAVDRQQSDHDVMAAARNARVEAWVSAQEPMKRE